MEKELEYESQITGFKKKIEDLEQESKMQIDSLTSLERES